jgi:hypothetical protein
VREKRHHWNNEYIQKNHDNHKHKEEDQECQEAKSPVRLQIMPQNSILIFKGYTGNVNVVYLFIYFIGLLSLLF